MTIKEAYADLYDLQEKRDAAQEKVDYFDCEIRIAQAYIDELASEIRELDKSQLSINFQDGGARND